MPVRATAVIFRVSIAYKARIRRRLTGDAGINPNRGRPARKLLPAQDVALAAHIRSRPGITLAQAWLLAEHGIELSAGAMWNSVRRLGLSVKKALHAAEEDRPDVAARRKLWRAAQPFIDPESLVFLDETGLNTKMARLYGWAPLGERCRDSVPFGHWKTMTFIAGLRLTGMTAPWVLDGPMAMPSGSMSATSARPRSGAAMAWRSTTCPRTRSPVSARRSPPGAPSSSPCRPDMNPSAMAFAKLKALLRQEPARTIDGLVERIGNLIDRFLPDQCANFFHAAGSQRSI